MQTFRSLTDLETDYNALEKSPSNNGTVEMIVRRPEILEREILEEAELDTEKGLIGDNWSTRGSRLTKDGNAHPDMQIAIMNSRIIQLIARDKSKWAMAGDQFFVDFDLSADNMPVGQRFQIGTAVLEVSPYPHNGCGKFTERYGSDATKFVNSQEGRALRRRGINARVIQNGVVRVGDSIQKLEELR